MNELQKIEFDLFLCFEEICEKLNLNYFLVCGSALGAARHSGFIPWDDDFDVGMYREDYDKFMELAPKLLPKGIFLQNYNTDPKFPYVFAKLRNSNTTFIQKLMRDFDINHGVYIDIFPLDGYPEKTSDRKKLFLMKKFYLAELASVFPYNSKLNLKGKISFVVFRIFGSKKRSKKILVKYEKLISQYPVKGSKIICNHGTWYGEKDYISADFYGKGSEKIFEGKKVYVPEKCEEYLAALYGDWRTLPPVEKRKGTHDCEICDTEKSYINYMK